MDKVEFVRLARRQGNVASVRQALALGTPRSSLDDLVRAMDMVRPHRGVVALPGADLSAVVTRRWVALCAVGSPAWIGGLAALAARGVVRDPAIVDVVVPTTRQPTPPPWARLQRLRVQPDDVCRRDGLPVLRAGRALAQAAALEPYDEALGAAAAAIQQQATTLAALTDVATRVRAGAPALRRIVRDLSSTQAQSILAHEVTVLLATRGFDLQAEVEVRRGDGRWACLDLVVRGTTVAIEVDGHATHSGRARLSADRTRQNNLVTEGWTVLRVDWLRLRTDPEGFVEEVRHAVARCSA